MKTKSPEIAKKFASIRFSKYVSINLVQFVCWLSFASNSILIYFKFVYDSLEIRFNIKCAPNMATIDYSSDWDNIKTSLMTALPLPQTYSAKKSIV